MSNYPQGIPDPPSDKANFSGTYPCMNCGKDIEGLPFCCSGTDCGCKGLPIDPPICSKECSLELYAKTGKRL